ncbi:DEP domain-containing mTOR-interacting protein-like [Lineus longissimus]|uniref:DEP domain-containing mTOR-interacting protein-like n=1 Tax=Lineus longissimus TaxID=88925 RepID=UPI002B4E05A8
MRETKTRKMALDTDVFLVGEQIRNDMKSAPNVIRDRRYHLRHFTSCFVGSECIDWLVQQGEAQSREVALAAMQLLVDHNIVHHVCDDHPFKDEYLFYRFRRDDNSFIDSKASKVLSRGLSLYRRLHGDLSVVIEHQEHGNTYEDSFYGDDLVTWLKENWNKKKSREDLEEECKELLEFGIIKHVTDDHHFKDGHLLYQFKPDFHRKRSLVGLLLTKSAQQNNVRPHADSNSSTTSSTPSLRKISVGSTCSSSSEASLSFMFQTTYSECLENDDSLPVVEGAAPKPVIIRKVTAVELEDPESPFVKKNISILADTVGFGFVVRGMSPTYVQTVDPTGPAASAGLKVRQYIYSVNGQVVLRKTHREVASIIKGCYDGLDLVVMMHFRDASIEKV